jgi:hypothetical protein
MEGHMSEEGTKLRWQHMISEPFEPASNATPDLRIACALEYIAAQLGEINRKLPLQGAPGNIAGGEF